MKAKKTVKKKMLLVCMDGVLRQLVLFSSKPLLILKQCKMVFFKL